MYRIMPSANRDSLTSSFQVGMPFISSSVLTALARTSSPMSNRRIESEHLCLVPNLRSKVFDLSPLSIILAQVSHE